MTTAVVVAGGVSGMTVDVVAETTGGGGSAPTISLLGEGLRKRRNQPPTMTADRTALPTTNQGT